MWCLLVLLVQIYEKFKVIHQGFRDYLSIRGKGIRAGPFILRPEAIPHSLRRAFTSLLVGARRVLLAVSSPGNDVVIVMIIRKPSIGLPVVRRRDAKPRVCVCVCVC